MFFLWSILPYKLNHASSFDGIPLMQFSYTPSPSPYTHTQRSTHTRRILELFLLQHDFTYHCGMGKTHCTDMAWVDCGRIWKYHMIKPCNSHGPHFLPDRRLFVSGLVFFLSYQTLLKIHFSIDDVNNYRKQTQFTCRTMHTTIVMYIKMKGRFDMNIFYCII